MSVSEAVSLIAALAAAASALAAWRSASLASSRTKPIVTLEASVGREGIGYHLENVGETTALHVIWLIVGEREKLNGRVEPAGVLRPGDYRTILPRQELRSDSYEGLVAYQDGFGTLHAWNLGFRVRSFRQRRWWWQVWRKEDYNLAELFRLMHPDSEGLGNRVPATWDYADELDQESA